MLPDAVPDDPPDKESSHDDDTQGIPERSHRGAAGHDHTLTFAPADLQKLKAGQTVTITSTTTLAHEHNVTASCA